MDKNKLAIILLDLGNLQVYAMQTAEDYANKSYKEIYWKHKQTGQHFGPFESIYEATMHFKQQEELRLDEKKARKVIGVDFKMKKRIGYYV